MHYPRDVIAGKHLAYIITGGLIQNKEFKKDFLKAAKEIELKKFPKIAVK